MALIECPECNGFVTTEADTSPHCGKAKPFLSSRIKTDKRILRNRAMGFLVILLLLILLSLVYALVKNNGDITSKMRFFEKMEIGTFDRVEITLNMSDNVVRGVALALMPKFKEVGFKILRLKDIDSGRYEDHQIE